MQVLLTCLHRCLLASGHIKDDKARCILGRSCQQLPVRAPRQSCHHPCANINGTTFSSYLRECGGYTRAALLPSRTALCEFHHCRKLAVASQPMHLTVLWNNSSCCRHLGMWQHLSQDLVLGSTISRRKGTQRTTAAGPEQRQPGRGGASRHGGPARGCSPGRALAQAPQAHPPPAAHRQSVAAQRPPCECRHLRSHLPHTRNASVPHLIPFITLRVIRPAETTCKEWYQTTGAPVESPTALWQPAR